MSANKVNDHRLMKVLLAPVISEKATMLAEAKSQAVFLVAPDASKDEVKSAVELLFKVQVTSVRLLNQVGKEKRFKGHVGRRNDKRKAYVTLAQGQEINLESEA